MNYHCWRNTRPKVNDNEKTWPKLPHPITQQRSEIKTILRSRLSMLNTEVATGSEDNDLQENLCQIDYPKLGEIVLKRKYNSMDNNEVEIHNNSVTPEARRLRRLKSTDLIHINLQKTLEKQKWPLLLQTNHPMKITIDICKLHVNMNVGNSVSNKWLLEKPKRSTTHIAKKRKPSRLKWLILYERMIQRRVNASKTEINRMEASGQQNINNDIPEINLERLQINVVPRDDPELLKKMSALSCLNLEYRNTKEVDAIDETMPFQTDLHQKIQQLCIEENNESQLNTRDENMESKIYNAEPIDCDAMDAALSLKICDAAEEFTDEISVKQEQSDISFSKKFREYCTNTITSNLKKCLEEFLSEISRLQKKMYERDNVKGKSKRRYYAGIKEVQKQIDLKRIKIVIIAPDLEKSKIEGGLDETVSKLISTCKRYEVPYCFGLGRRKLGYYIHGTGFVSCIGIASYSGAEEKLKNVLYAVVEARNEFMLLANEEAKIIDVKKLLPRDDLIMSEIINVYLKILASTN